LLRKRMLRLPALHGVARIRISGGFVTETITDRPVNVEVMTVPHGEAEAARSPRVVESRTRMLLVDGLHWIVRESAYSALDRRTGTCLIFDAESVIRRVRSFPANWYTLSPEDLYAVSLGP